MLTALILVCSLAVTPDFADCNHKTDVLRAVTSSTIPSSQAYLAQAAVGR